jgi:hypothetical protein
MSYTKPDLASFKLNFFRDFPYQPIGTTDLDKYIQDEDIGRALLKAASWVNEGLFNSQDAFTDGFLLMAAHCMVMSIRASSQGLAGKFDWATASKGVGSVSISQAIPSSITNNPTYAWIAMSSYGVEYLVMVLPAMTGFILSIEGSTQA